MRQRHGTVVATFLVGLATATVPASPAPANDDGHVWYVDNSAAPDGDGSMVAPFDRLARAERAADAGDTIYVFRGDGTDRGLDEGIRLRPGQQLLGSGVALEVAGEERLPAGEPPLLGAASGPVLTLADHVYVAGIDVHGGGETVVEGTGVADAHLRLLRVDGGGVATAGVALAGARDSTLDEVRVTAVRRFGIRLLDATGVTLRRSHVDHAGTAAGDAALLLRDPAGELRIEATDLEARAGAALAVEATRGEASVHLAGVGLAGDDDATAPVAGLDVRTAGDAVLSLAATVTALARLRGTALSLVAEEHGQLRLELAGCDVATDVPGRPETALSALAREGGLLEVYAHSNHLLAHETAFLFSANGRGHLRAEVAGNTVGGAGAARGLVVLLGDLAEASVEVASNHFVGQRAEAFYAVAASQTSLGVAAHDNDLASGSAGAPSGYPALLVETRDASRACLALAGNRFADGSGGGPHVRLRQRDSSHLALSGFEPAASEGGAAQHLTASNRLGRVEVEGERALAAPAGLPCPASPPAVAAGH